MLGLVSRGILAVLAFALCLAEIVSAQSQAQPLLDGEVFSGMIGPEENPDLQDKLYFRDGMFWSGICTECGFLPGVYQAAQTEKGVVFSGELTSDSRGVFAYEGLIRPDGEIKVDINWSRKRWYWTAKRHIIFKGQREGSDAEVPELQAVLRSIETGRPENNPRCARF